MDATASHQGGGLGTATQPDYGYALPVTDGPAALERMEVTPEGTWAQEVHEAYDFLALGSVAARSTTLHLAGAADDARARWATTPASQIGREFLEFYQNRYPGLTEAKPPKMTDDRAANRVTVVERYFLPFSALDQNGLRRGLRFRLHRPDRPLSRPADPAPAAAAGRGRAMGLQPQGITVTDAPIDFTPPEDVAISNPAFDFSLKGTAWRRRSAWT